MLIEEIDMEDDTSITTARNRVFETKDSSSIYHISSMKTKLNFIEKYLIKHVI